MFVCSVALVGCKPDTGCVEGDCVNGQGTYSYRSGSRYVGEFKYGKRNGKGTLTRADGVIFPCGLWKDDEPVK